MKEPVYVENPEQLLDVLIMQEPGSYVAERIPIDVLDACYQVHFQSSQIHTVRTGKQTFSIPSRFHKDAKGKEAIQMSRDLGKILKERRCFSYLKETFPRVGSIASHITGVVAKRARPFFDRKPELKAMKGYFGGRSENFQETGRGHLVEYDIPSAYPTCSLGLLPVGAPFRVRLNSNTPEGYLDMVKIDVVIQNDFGVLPVRDGIDTSYPAEGRLAGLWFWEDEVETVLDYCETVRNYRVLERMRFKARDILAEEMSALIALRHKHKEHEKTLKAIANQIIGMFAFKGIQSIVYYTKDWHDVQNGDWPIMPDIGLWGRRTPTKTRPHTYRPFISSKIWSNARARLVKAIATTHNPVSCHIDCMTALKQDNVPLETIEKKDYGIVSWECPYRGALFLNGERVKSPGVQRK